MITKVNAVCPGVTDTPMTGGVISAFRDAGLFWQPPSAVAKVIVGIEADTSIVGKAFYIEGDGAWEFENSFYDAQPQWLGEFLHVLHLAALNRCNSVDY